MRTQKTHWPTRSPFKPERPTTEHLLSERILRERLAQITDRIEEGEKLKEELDAAIRQSRVCDCYAEIAELVSNSAILERKHRPHEGACTSWNNKLAAAWAASEAA
jgi:hypothetical protein